jgi:3-phosphoglycerate kinase
MKIIENAELNGKKVLIRADFNVPIENGVISDANRIDAALPTIEYCLENGAVQVIILAHLGQPTVYPDLKLTLKPVAEYLAKKYDFKLVEKPKFFPEELAGFQVAEKVILVENTRFTKNEEENNPDFAKAMSEFGDVFIFDAFASAHRAHASTVGIMNYLPSYAGILVEKELGYLEPIRETPRHPFVVMVGGAKVSDKLPTIEFLAELADCVLVGGVIANTFMRAMGIDVKSSKCERDQINNAKRIIELLGDKLVIPEDYVWDNKQAICDIGPKTVMRFIQKIGSARAVLWNGNLGKTEDSRYEAGTLNVARYMAIQGSLRVVAGGDTVGYLNELKLAHHMTFVSTGGSATLDYLAGKKLPALTLLQ